MVLLSLRLDTDALLRYSVACHCCCNCGQQTAVKKMTIQFVNNKYNHAVALWFVLMTVFGAVFICGIAVVTVIVASRCSCPCAMSFILSVCVFICLFVRLLACLHIMACVLACLFVSLFACEFLPVSLPVCLSISSVGQSVGRSTF